MTFDDKQKDIAQQMGKTKMLKFMRGFRKVFNSMCYDCRKLAMHHPTRPASDYCDKCEQKLTTYLEKFK